MQRQRRSLRLVAAWRFAYVTFIRLRTTLGPTIIGGPHCSWLLMENRTFWSLHRSQSREASSEVQMARDVDARHKRTPYHQ